MDNNLLASDELLRLRAKEVKLGFEVDVMATSNFSVEKLDLPQISEDLPEDFFAKVPSAADDVAKCSGDRFEDGEFSIKHHWFFFFLSVFLSGFLAFVLTARCGSAFFGRVALAIMEGAVLAEIILLHEIPLRKKRESSDKSSRRIVTQRPNACSARSLRSDRVRAKAQSLRSDQTPIPLGRCVATGHETKFSRYGTTKLFRNVDTTSVHAFSSILRCYLPNIVANPSHVPRHF
ncbi:hypothetical protein DY000_02008504 [Brassica cretica]|uniref:Uncharacterized protein n=1 Tax=Brassica cretica TaxID=69181 RepID=A0ABQ7CB09_BRACR|nr:hypothetical protein DY000_02008504 [Brassica cretica]